MFRSALIYSLIFLSCAWSNSGFAQTSPRNQGYIHGTITFEYGNMRTGYLRWEKEEAHWDDLFHCGYRKNPWLEYIDHETLDKEKRDQFYATHGLIERLAYALGNNKDSGPGWRMLLIQFGDIHSFEIHSGKDDYIITADGLRHKIGGYANDNGSDLWFYENGQDPMEIEWNDLTSIVFSVAPAEHAPYAQRLFGTVETKHGNFTGPIMWDKSECLSIDILDGENDDGDLAISMGDIRRIRKVDTESVFIEEKSGAEYPMRGSNDVNNGNRGIWINTSDRGWVDVPWKHFIAVTFSDETTSGAARTISAHKKPMQGVVQLMDGTKKQGRLVYDLDEGFAWDYFNGDEKGIGYDIPFHLISELQRIDNETCRVILTTGISLDLTNNQDTGADHGGILIIHDNNHEKTSDFLPWRSVKSVKLNFN